MKKIATILYWILYSLAFVYIGALILILRRKPTKGLTEKYPKPVLSRLKRLRVVGTLFLTSIHIIAFYFTFKYCESIAVQILSSTLMFMGFIGLLIVIIGLCIILHMMPKYRATSEKLDELTK